jgi:hypothetical protein
VHSATTLQFNGSAVPRVANNREKQNLCFEKEVRSIADSEKHQKIQEAGWIFLQVSGLHRDLKNRDLDFE